MKITRTRCEFDIFLLVKYDKDGPTMEDVRPVSTVNEIEAKFEGRG